MSKHECIPSDSFRSLDRDQLASLSALAHLSIAEKNTETQTDAQAGAHPFAFAPLRTLAQKQAEMKEAKDKESKDTKDTKDSKDTHKDDELLDLDTIVDSVMSGIIMPYTFLEQKTQTESKTKQKQTSQISVYPFPAPKITAQQLNDTRSQTSKAKDEIDQYVLLSVAHEHICTHTIHETQIVVAMGQVISFII